MIVESYICYILVVTSEFYLKTYTCLGLPLQLKFIYTVIVNVNALDVLTLIVLILYLELVLVCMFVSLYILSFIITSDCIKLSCLVKLIKEKELFSIFALLGVGTIHHPYFIKSYQ